MAEIEDFGEIRGNDGIGVKVPGHTNDTRHRAAEDLLSGDYGVTDETAIQQLASKAIQVTFRLHASDPEENDCGCEGAGWWCERGDGEPTPFWWFDSYDALKAAENVEDGGDLE